jgi:hypothetical protein
VDAAYFCARRAHLTGSSDGSRTHLTAEPRVPPVREPRWAAEDGLREPFAPKMAEEHPGVRVFVDEWSLEPGDKPTEAMEDAFATAKIGGRHGACLFDFLC